MEFRPAVVVHYKSGDIKKGYTRNFAFFRNTFDLTEVDSKTQEELQATQVQVEDLKAVFFVKNLDGNPDYHSQPDSVPERHGFGDRVEITFMDNETMIGYTPRYRENNNGFILYPADSKINNDIVAVIRSAAQIIKPEQKHSFFYL
ncbi:MAG: hypothetical protein COZ32_02060 [Nitrospirae bacterium CG_4_10_14_3_um_filter_53_41]|nr:MAG: hypothetical protein COZ32_02060 [Nitrospirae bacterium CG_4_10_14_3_um_filter_53_41]